MKNLTKPLSFLLLSGTIILITYCSNKSHENKEIRNVSKTSSNGQILFRVAVGKDTLIVCNYSEVKKDVIDVKLSSFIDSCRIVRLETSENAFIKLGNTTISENFIGVRNTGQVPYKLFDHSGKFIRNIGKIGRGPNEYTTIYSEIVDEKNNCIYLMPWNRNQILRYDLNGNPLTPINLKFNQTKSRIFIKHDTITVINLPFSPNDKIAYIQTFDGQIINSLAATYHALKPDFSNEIFSSNNSKDIDLHLSKFFQVVNDTLFHYQKNRLQPVFTMFFDEIEIPIHHYFELPNYFICEIMAISESRGNSTIATSHELIIVNKTTLKANRFHLINDYLGNIEMDFNFINGKFINNIYANKLKDKISAALNNDNLSVKNRDQLTSFNKSFNVDDNNIVFYGDLK